MFRAFLFIFSTACLLCVTPLRWVKGDDETNRKVYVIAGPRRWGSAGLDVLSRPEDKRDLIAAAWVYDASTPKPKHQDPTIIDWVMFSTLGATRLHGVQWFAFDVISLSELSELDSLEILDLSGVELSVKELASLRGRFTDLKVVLIEDVALSVEHLEELLNGRSIEVISLYESGLTESEIDKFRLEHPNVLIYVDERFVIEDSLLLKHGVSRSTNIEGQRYPFGFPAGGRGVQDELSPVQNE